MGGRSDPRPIQSARHLHHRLRPASLVLGICHSRDFLDTPLLQEDPGAYLMDHPWRCFAAAGGFYALAYGIAYAASRMVHRESAGAIVPGATSWTRAIRNELPKGNRAVVITVELRDGRHVTGVVRSFTVAEVENRELHLVAPIKVRTRAGLRVNLPEDFLIVREEDVLAISGRYVKGNSSS